MQEFKDKGFSGLINLGNTCYLNSAVQCLSNTLPLTQYVLSDEFQSDIDLKRKEYKMCKEYYRLLVGIWEENCTIKPISFKQTLASFDPRFAGFRQHDSQEALSLLIDLLHTGLSYEAKITYRGTPQNDIDRKTIEAIKTWGKMFKDQYSKILEIFYGQFNSEIKCGSCGKISNTFDPFNILSVPITSKTTTLYDCLDIFSNPETLDTDNLWLCEHCKQRSQANKRITLWKTPNVLIIGLKRFNFHGSAAKINKKIDLPFEDLDLSNYVDGYDKTESKYDLFAFINHTGSTHGGHYFVYCQNANGKWYEFNDASVREINDVKCDNAYIAFYKKKNT